MNCSDGRRLRIVVEMVFLTALLSVFSAAVCAAQAAAPFRFAVYGDTRDGHDVHRQVVAQLIRSNPAFVLQTGDLVARGTDASLWRIYDDITAEMRRKIPVYPARGNHDVP